MNDELWEPIPPKYGKYETLEIEKEDGIDWVTLNRAESLNAMNHTMIMELEHYFGKLYTTQSTRVIILKGAGKGFCSGLDLKKGQNHGGKGPVNGLRLQRAVGEIMMRMRRCPQPIIAALHGAASGGGFALALASDIRIAAEDTKMNVAFIRIGLTGCDVGVSYFLPRMVGSSLASELILTGRFIYAERAKEIGLVSEVVEKENLDNKVRELAYEILDNSPIGVRLSKECLNMSIDASSLHSVIAMEDRQQILVAQTQDMMEGVSAFFEKRKPEYKEI